MENKKLFLLDALALIYRAHFAFIRNPRMTSKGQNTSAIFGFVNSLIEVLGKYAPTHLGVAFDTSAPTFRHVEFPEYKAQREAMPEDIRWAIPMIKKMLELMNIPILQLDGFEADDIIGTLAQKAEAHGFTVYMVTPDKDYAQLVTDNILLYKPARMGNGVEILDPQKVKEKMGIPPERVADFLGLKGDAVDNIPGIPKVGDKTAVSLIEEFGTVEQIIERVEEVTKKSIKESILQNAQQGILSKQLATIKTDVEVPWEEENLKIGEGNPDALIKMFQELEFKTITQRLFQTHLFRDRAQLQTDLFGNPQGIVTNTITEDLGPKFNTLETRPHSYVFIESEKEVHHVIQEIKKAGEFAFDTETTSLDPMQAKLISIAFTWKDQDAHLMYFEEGEKRIAEKLAVFQELFLDENILKIAQNLKYDALVLKNYGLEIGGAIYDTMLADYVVNPDKSHSMDNLARELLNYEPIPISSLIGKKGKHQLTMRVVPKDKLLEYACEDTDVTFGIKQKLAPMVVAHEVEDVLEKIEFPLVSVLTDMEFTGVLIDKDQLALYSVELEKEQQQLEAEIFSLAGERFNINSPAQLGHIIFDKLKLAKGKKTKTGKYSTKEEILTELASDHEMPAKVLRFRQLGKLKSTYVDALPALINPKTGRVHTTYSQAVANTGRLSSNKPNLQNIPIRTSEGREIRKAFIPQPGHVLLAADYSQVELRVMAHLSGDPGMTEDFINGHDIHKATAARVFGVGIDEVDSEMRSKAKMVNFGIIYGISAFGLSQRLKIARSEAADIIEAYFEKYTGIKTFMDKSIADARELGYAKTIMGRKRTLTDINSQNHTIRSFAERNAINMPVQGSAADLIKIAMIDIYKSLSSKPYKTKMIMQVHDELVFEVPKDEVEVISALVKEKMENAIAFSVPMKVEVGIGDTWLEAH